MKLIKGIEQFAPGIHQEQSCAVPHRAFQHSHEAPEIRTKGKHIECYQDSAPTLPFLLIFSLKTSFVFFSCSSLVGLSRRDSRRNFPCSVLNCRLQTRRQHLYIHEGHFPSAAFMNDLVLMQRYLTLSMECTVNESFQ